MGNDIESIQANSNHVLCGLKKYFYRCKNRKIPANNFLLEKSETDACLKDGETKGKIKTKGKIR